MSSDSEVSDESCHDRSKRFKLQEKSSSPTAGPSSSSCVQPTTRKTEDKTKTWRKQAYSDSWSMLPEFKGWIAAAPGDKYKVKCLPCKKLLTAGKSELIKHSKTSQHLKHWKSMQGSTSITSFVKPILNSAQIDSEIRVSLLAVQYNVSFHAMEGILSSMKCIINDSQVLKKIKLKRTKCTNIINNVVCKAILNSSDSALRNNFFSILIDESTDLSNDKNLCILVKYYVNQSHIVHLLDIIKVSDGASAAQLFQAFSDCLKKHEIDFKNIVGYCSDNANVMLGKKHSFMTFLLKENPQIFVIGCICHSAHLIASHAADELPTNLEALMHNLYSYFSRSPKRQALLEGIQNIMKKEKHKLINPSRTRWLALLNSVNRILEQWSILQQTFVYASVEDRSANADIILNDLNNPYTKAYFEFLQHALPYFQSFNLVFQAEHFLLTNLKTECCRFLRLLSSNFVKPDYLNHIENIDVLDENRLLPIHSVNIGKKAETTLGDITENINKVKNYEDFKKRCRKFYQTAVIQSIARLPLKHDIISEIQYIEPKIALRRGSTNRLSIENICNKYKNIINVEATLSEYNNLGIYFEEEEISNLENLTTQEFWLKLSNVKDVSNRNVFENICKLTQIVMSLPHSNAAVERIFSMVSDIKTKKKKQIKHKNIEFTD